VRLAYHSPAVTPPVMNLAFSGFLTDSATTSLMFDIGSRITDAPGRVKNTRDQRVCFPCSPGGWLSAHPVSVDSLGFRAAFTYITRWRFDLSNPPLKIAIASPVEVIQQEGKTTLVNSAQTNVADSMSRNRLVKT
jgi:hypothetical protein